MKPDDPKEYMISSLKSLISLIEQDKMILRNISEEVIGYPYFPSPLSVIPRGRKITLELYYATEKRN